MDLNEKVFLLLKIISVMHKDYIIVEKPTYVGRNCSVMAMKLVFIVMDCNSI